MSLFKGSGVAIVTPMHDDGSVDYKAYEKLVQFHLENGTDSIIVCGTTGESATVTDEENEALVKLTVDIVNKKIPVIAGAGSNNTAHAIHLSQQAEKAGADGLLHVTPYYNKATQRGLIRHFTEIAQSTSLPIILYSVASRTSTNIEPNTVYELSKVKNIVGIKEASNDISQIAEIARICGNNMDIYSGNDDQIVPILSLGGIGVISVVANVAPKMVHDVVMEYLSGNHAKSLEIQLNMLELVKAMFMVLNPIPAKEALGMMGMINPYMRSPLCAMDENERGKLRSILEKYSLV